MSRLALAIVFVENGKLGLLTSRDSVLERFSPIDTREKALAIAELFTGRRANYDPQPTPQGPYYVSRVEGTTVAPTKTGFRAAVFEQSVFGCGMKPRWRDVVDVNTKGEVVAVKSTALWADRAVAGMCVD